MCGINGYYRFSQDDNLFENDEVTSTISTMNDIIIHRGPDADGLYLQNPICFGFRRLSIIDLHPEANQPMFSRDARQVIVFNGEIYNYKEIRYQLIKKGYLFNTTSDTEVILNAYLEYGEKCVQQFNGMWAFAIYDFDRQKLFCSRDRMGVKPFFYVKTEKDMFFSSELKALHKACSLHKAEHTKVFEYLAYGYKSNDGKTFFEGCSELLPGYNLVIENNQFRLDQYWSLKSNLHSHQRADIHQEFTELFRDAVSLRYRSDVPVALLLSGGLDSTAIAKVTDELIESGNIAQNTVQAFIASFPGYKYDETAIAKAFVKTCKHIELNELQLDSSKMHEQLDSLVYGFDSPVASFTTVAHQNIMRECHNRGIKVVLNGQGSDEAFAGYDRYFAGIHLLDALYSNRKQFLKEFSAYKKHNGYSTAFLLGQIFKGLVSPRVASWLRARFQEKTLSCLNTRFISDNYAHYEAHYAYQFGHNNLTDYLLSQINFQGLNQILHYEDISSMNQSIEIRSPFMDYRLMEFAFSISNDHKIKQGVTKRILRETIGENLPDNIVNNRIKIGFRTPATDYLVKDDAMRQYLSLMFKSPEFSGRKIWNHSQIQRVFSNPDQYPNFPFWRFMNLEIWAKQYQINNL